MLSRGKINRSTLCDRIWKQIGMKNEYYAEPQEISRGLALWWKEEIDVQIITVTHNLMDCEIKLNQQNKLIWVTWIYADVNASRRHSLWNELRNFGRGRSRILMFLGDFNDISQHHEKEGGSRESQRLIDAFNSMIEDIQMEDLGANGQTSYSRKLVLGIKFPKCHMHK